MIARFTAVVPLEALDGAGAAMLRSAFRWRGALPKTNGHHAASLLRAPLPLHEAPLQQQQQHTAGRRLSPVSARGSASAHFSAAASARGAGAARGAQLPSSGARTWSSRRQVLGERSLRLLRELNRYCTQPPQALARTLAAGLIPALALALTQSWHRP